MDAQEAPAVEEDHFREDRITRALSEGDEPDARTRTLWSRLRDEVSPEFFGGVTAGSFAAYLNHLAECLNGLDEDERYAVDLRPPRDDTTPWNPDHTLLTIAAEPLPFVVDSLYELLHERNVRIDHSLHHHAGLSETEVVAPKEGPRERLLVSLYLEVLSPGEFDALAEDLERTLEDLVMAADDFQPMLERARAAVERLGDYAGWFPDRREAIEGNERFLQYLIDDRFVFLGYRESTLARGDDGEDGTGDLGVLRRKNLPGPLFSTVPVTDRDEFETGSGSLITVAKTNLDSRVYRREKLDYVGLKRVDEDGKLLGEYGFVGLFTDRVLAEPAVRIPLLDHKFEEIVRREGLREHTHDFREFYAVYNSMPKHLLFMTPADELAEDLRSIAAAHEETSFRMLARQHPSQRGLTIMVLMPRARFSGQTRRTIEAELRRELEPESLEDRLYLGNSEVARLHFDLQTDRDRPRCGTFRELEGRLDRLTRSWLERLDEALHEQLDEPERAEALFHRYGEALPDDYRGMVEPEAAVGDVLRLEEPSAGDRVRAQLRHPSSSTFAHLLLYSPDRLELNETLPLLANHGLTVHEHHIFEVALEDRTTHLHLLPVQEPGGGHNVEETLLRSIEGVLEGRLRDDVLNRLITEAELTPRAINLLRLYKNYYHQLDPGLKLETINRVLIDEPEVTRRLLELFRTRFEPAVPDDRRREREEQLDRRLTEAVEGLTARTRYEILRTLHNLVSATVRTNFFQPARDEQWVQDELARHDRSGRKHYISIKVDPSLVEEMPSPRPRHEIFVYSPFMEGVHLRGGDVARGGIRWSDRRDDYRVEIRELMQTQQVKNAVIVPDGAKGGFVVKEEYLEEDLRTQVRRQYEVFMHGLLDLTDNRVDGEVVPPEDTVRRDDPDPYLVVAADRGTATFSDLANAVADRHDFWMGDAFATGGSNGYDHKELGITARGAWECVKRHFREMGRDPLEESLSVVGIGDMSGDVFGNGLLLSEDFRLLAAFDHRHVFLDPDPDPTASHEERRRLFEMEDSTWMDYDDELLEPHGGVYDRGAGLIDPSEAARERFGLPAGKLQPGDVIRAILTADVDLLWNGGIGTYVKASRESHAAVGDPKNDAVRVDAASVRADVVAEGGNLGITRQGRVELDRHGVRLNTDAVDNSGGVDLSDHEVNLKLFFRELERRGDLERDRRNDLLETLSGDVVQRVLKHNDRQSAVIGLERLDAGRRLEDYRELMDHLEASAGLDRSLEALPDEREMRDRQRTGRDMTRPELAVLLSYVKQDLQRRSRGCEWPKEWVLERFLRRYFPDRIVELDADRLEDHPLRRELALTTLVNDAVDRAGITYFHRLNRETGAGPRELLLWYQAADELACGPRLRRTIREAEGTVPNDDLYRTWRWIQDQLAGVVAWMVDAESRLDPPAAFTEHFEERLDRRAEAILDRQGSRRQKRREARCRQWKKQGFDRDFCRVSARLGQLVPLLNILRLEEHAGEALEDVAELYFEAGRTLHIHWLMDGIQDRASADRWDQFTARNTITELHRLQAHLTDLMLRRGIPLSAFTDRHADTISRLGEVRRDVEATREPPLSAFQFMVQRLRGLVGSD